MKLEATRGGKGGRLIVFLHGLGATRHVWLPIIESGRWNGAWLAPDLRGHGASAWTEDYALASHAADVADLVRASRTWDEIVVLGHSMGGAIALALGSGAYGIAPSHVFGLGIKVAWTDEERAGIAALAARPVRTFASEDEAIARYLKSAGLSGLVAPELEAAHAGIRKTADGWQLAADPAAISIGPPPMQELIAAARTRVHLACGVTDQMVKRAQLTAFDPDACTIAGGHNAMVESPSSVWDWIDSKLPARTHR